jgi:two-component system, OmpR family, manganese sensing sensor histidine kinase
VFHLSRRRLAYWFTLSMGSILLLFAFTIYYLQLRDRIGVFDETLYTQAKRIAMKTDYRFERGRLQIDTDAVSLQDSQAQPLKVETEIAYVRWYDDRGKLVQFIGTDAPKQLNSRSLYQTLQSERESERWLRQLTIPVKQGDRSVGYLQVAAPLSPIQETLAQTRLFLSLGVPLALGLTGLVGALTSNCNALLLMPLTSYERL